MLISVDSPLRLIPPTLDTRTVLFLDGIRYSIEILDLHFRRLVKTLAEIQSMKSAAPELGPKTVEAILDAWGMIDSANRLRELAQQMPGLKQKDPKLQSFLRQTAAVKSLRDFVQHFRSGMDGFVSKKMPLWGVLSWSPSIRKTKSPKCFTLIPGTYYTGLGAYSLTFHRRAGRFVGRCVLLAGDDQVDLAELKDRVIKFLRWFENWCQQSYKLERHHTSDVLLTVTVHDSKSGIG